MFQFFRNALDTQNEEVKMLHNEVTELERVNSEILDFVHKNGRLPEIINERGNLESASNKDDIGVYRGSESNHDDKHQQLEVFLKSINMLRFCYNQTVTRRSPNSSVITDVISKNAEELRRVLMVSVGISLFYSYSMNLESSKSNHIVDHIQKNMDNVVNTDTTAYESQLDFDKKTTCLTPQRGIDSSISEIVDVSDHNESPANPECSGDDSNQSRNDGQPQYSFPPTISTVTYELRRRELLRANQRLTLNPSYSLNNSTEGLTGHISYHQSMPSSLSAQLPSSECRAICIPDNHSLHYFNSNPNTTMSLSDSVLRYCVPEVSPLSSTLQCNFQSLYCYTCKNPGIIHGFTVLSAVFRGRLTRQLLATRKVHDLIRTVKDTAKLILSIRLDQRNISFQSEFISTSLLESKLLIQLYNILNEIHEIFFKWSITKQISLIYNSNLSSYKMDYSFTKLTNQTSTNSLRILRQLQPHQVNSLPKSKQINNYANGEEKKSNISIISNKRNPYHSINNNNKKNNKLINKFSPKQQLTHNINKNQLKNNQKECYKQQSISNTFIQSNINNSIYYKSINKTNQYITRSISTNNTLNNKVNRSSSRRKNYINRTKSIEPKIIRHFSNKIDPIQYNNNNNNTSTIDSLNSNNNNNDPLNITVNSELEIHSKNDQYTSTLKSTNISTDVNNFPNIKTIHTEKCHETVVEEKRLSTSSKQVSSSTLSQCETNLHAPLTIIDNNNTSVQRCFPVKRRILSRKLKNDYSNNPIHVSTQNNSSNSTCNNYNNDVSFLIQDNQSINNTLHSNDNEIKYNYEISNNLYQKNSELRATWTLDSKTYPSLTIDTINLSN
ncbi:uncharacterized protein DC041_0011585 [Schistosoma bovis]|uniref:Uncharacterized protein n=1 Tax=Schistosoma bovis TaxID=6184 RepID=A0A430QMY1_SCHBO|nr:uncharacterized protein DC041_0011585 [Schistosoma bovis]